MIKKFLVICVLSCCPVSFAAGNVEVRGISDTTGNSAAPRFSAAGGCVFAHDPESGRGIWSDDGIVYHELGALNDSNAKPSPFFVRHQRLYAVLSSEDGRNVLIALDLRAEGRLVWRIEPRSLGLGRFDKFLRIQGDTLSVRGSAADGKEAIMLLDVATGTQI